MRLRARKLPDPRIPTAPRTIPEHLRRQRHDLGLTQRQAAARVGVCVATYGSWESGEFTPGIRQYPAIYGFLGLCPMPGPALGARLEAWRRARGLPVSEVGRLVGLDAGTLGRLERAPARPVYERIRRAVNGLFEG